MQQRRLSPEEFTTCATRLAQDPGTTWLELAARYLTWDVPPTRAWSGSFADGSARWFADGRLDPTVSCLDRHLETRGDAPALIAVGDDPEVEVRWNFRELHAQVCRAANALAALGVGAGDTVGLCLPTIPEAAVAMLACARLGALHGMVFAGFGVQALAQRWNDLGCRVIVTADAIRRGGRCIPLKTTVDAALNHCPHVESALIVGRGENVPWTTGRDHHWTEALDAASPVCPPTFRPGDAPLFVLHTSGTTGRPKGMLHSSAGFLLHVALTHHATTGYQDGDRYACLADLGWITGHSYVLYGPLVNGAPVVLDQGTPLYPGPERYWRLVEQLRLNVLFTVPTALRLIIAQGAQTLLGLDLSSLRVLACAGEILDHATCAWIATHLPRVRVVNIYGQTEGAGHLLASNTGVAQTDGLGLQPCLGVSAALVDEQGTELKGSATGRLVIVQPWPGLAQTIHGDHDRFVRSYLTAVPGCYTTGDVALRDAHGIYTVIGRADDVMNLAGHRLAPAELESLVRAIPGVVDVLAVGVPDHLRGQMLVLFVVREGSAEWPLTEVVRSRVREQLGAFATPRAVVSVAMLPRTRSGKPLRRLLSAVVADTDPGDLSTLADAAAVEIARTAWAEYLKDHPSCGLSGLPISSPGS